MRYQRFIRSLTLACLGLLLAVFAQTPSMAADVYLVAKPFINTMPDGNKILMWGFAKDADNNLATRGTEVPTAPGPYIGVNAADPILRIFLRNDLKVPVSIVIPGQTASLAAVRFTDSQGRQRVRSFTTETMPGGTSTYTWVNLKPGTYLYQSGTQPAVQVQMGLYGGMIKNAAFNVAYTGNLNINGSYDKQVVLFYSEIDPDLHAAVASNTAAPATRAILSPAAGYPVINYKPKYFLVNGSPYFSGKPSIPAGSVNQRTLVRFFNMGLESHVPTLLGMDMEVIAEDGNLYPYAKKQYSLLLPAGKTADAILTPVSGGTYPLYDRTLSLVNRGASPGGMLSHLNVGP